MAGCPERHIHHVRAEMPQQVIGPGTRLARGRGVGPAKQAEETDHVLDLEFTLRHAAPHLLYGGKVTHGVRHHQPPVHFPGEPGDALCLVKGQRHGDLHEHVLAGLQCRFRLVCMKCIRRGNGNRIEFRVAQGIAQVQGMVLEPPARSKLRARLHAPADQPGRMHVIDFAERFHVLFGDGAISNQADVHFTTSGFTT